MYSVSGAHSLWCGLLRDRWPSFFRSVSVTRYNSLAVLCAEEAAVSPLRTPSKQEILEMVLYSQSSISKSNQGTTDSVTLTKNASSTCMHCSALTLSDTEPFHCHWTAPACHRNNAPL